MPHKAPDCKARLKQEREPRRLTQLPNLEDFTEHFRELDGTAAEGALVLVFSAAVLQDDLWGDRTGRVRAARRGGQRCGARTETAGPQPLPGCRYPDGL